jgi:ubiquinone/menaquinone biosynthesis C-methylase UbiE
MDDQLKAKWERGKNNTLRHYTKKLPWKVKKHNHESYLPDYFGPMIGNKKEVTIAEIGSGMFCTIGSAWKTSKVKVFPSDILADEFNQILKDNGITPFITIAKENMESLSYPDNFFDITHSCNALDHTADPIKAIREMYRVTKPGGYIYLRHFVNVGEHEGYSGLHMWNIDINDKGDCVIWNPDKKFLLSDFYSGFKSVKKKELDYETEDMVVSILHKE